MPLPKRRSPRHRKDRRERSPAKSLSLYHRKESHHHSEGYMPYSHANHYRPSATSRDGHRSRSPVARMASPHSPTHTMSMSRRHRFSPASHHDSHNRRDHPRKGYSPIPRRSPVSMKRRSKSPLWSSSRQVVPSMSPIQYSGQPSSSYKKSGQSFGHSSSQRASLSNYHHDSPLPSSSSYNNRKMSPNASGYSQLSYQSSHAVVPEDTFSRVALGRSYLQNHRRCTLTDRFKMLEPETSFHFDENITIGIHRNSQVAPGSPQPVRRDFNPYEFVMIRQKNEGARALFDREELRQYSIIDVGEEELGYKELRVVTVASHERGDYPELSDEEFRSWSPSYVATEDEVHGYLDRQRKKRYEGSRPVSSQRSSHDRWTGESGRMKPLNSSPHYYGGGMPAYPESSRGQSRDWERMERVQHNPDDLRHSINARFIGSPRRKIGHEEESYIAREYTSKRRDSKYSRTSTDPSLSFSKHSDKYSDWKDLRDVNSQSRSYYALDSKSDVSPHRESGRSYGHASNRPALLKTPPVGVRGRASILRGGFRARPVSGRFRNQIRGSLSRRGRGRVGSSASYSSSHFHKSEGKISHTS